MSSRLGTSHPFPTRRKGGRGGGGGRSRGKLQALVCDILPSFGGRCRKAILGVGAGEGGWGGGHIQERERVAQVWRTRKEHTHTHAHWHIDILVHRHYWHIQSGIHAHSGMHKHTAHFSTRLYKREPQIKRGGGGGGGGGGSNTPQGWHLTGAYGAHCAFDNQDHTPASESFEKVTPIIDLCAMRVT